MTWWWKSLFRKRALDAQLTSEVRFHIDELTDANIAAGMSPMEARRRAVLEFGGGEQIKEELRDVHRVRVIESAIANLKSAFRFIRKIAFDGVVIIWWEKAAGVYRFFTCFNDADNPCEVRGTAHWEGDAFVNDYEEVIEGKKVKFRDSFINITATSHNLVAAMDFGNGTMKTIITTTSTRR